MSNNLKYSGLQTFGPISAEQISITGEYTLPLLDGTANQILSTNGAGTVQFIDLSNLQIVTATNILNGTGINWTIIGLNTVQGDVTLAPFSTTDLAEGTNLYFTDERVDDRVSNLFQSGITGTSGVTPLAWIYNDLLNTFTPQVSISAFTTDNLPQGSSNLYFSGELVDDRVAALLKPAITGTNPTNPIVWNYVDGLDSLTPQVSLGPFDTDDLSEGSTNLYFTDNRAIDAVGNSLVNSATVTWNFNSILNTIEATASTGISGMAIKLDGGLVGTQPTLEFLTGSNIILNAANDPINSKVTLQIESTLGGNLEDLNDVFFLSPGPQFEEVLYFNGAGWTSTDLESILPANYESITYADLKTKALANDLIPNRMYLISDYETIYYMPGTSPQVEMTGANEPLIVKAIAVNELSPIAYSPTYPQDIIYYKLIPESGLRNVSATNKGIIYYRQDTKDRNIYPADFRNVECRRWDDGSGNYEILAENGNAFTDYPIFGPNCRDNKVESLNPDFATAYGIAEDLPNVYFLSDSVGNTFSAFTYGITPGNYMSNIQSSGIIVNIIFRNIANSIFNTSVIRNTTFIGAVVGFIVKAENNGAGIDAAIFGSSVENCEVATIQNSTFTGKFSDSKINAIVNSSFGAALQFVDIYLFSNVTTSSNFTYSQGILVQDCTFAGVVSQFYFKRLQNIDFQGVDECQMTDYLNSSVLTVGSNFVRNVFLNEIADSSFGDGMNGCTFNGKITNCTFGDNMTDCVFLSTITNSTFGDQIIRTTFNNRVLSSTFGSSGISYCTFANEVRNCTFDNVLSSVYFNGNVDTFEVSSTSTALDKVTFITSIASYTIATGSANLANGNLYTEVIADSLGGSGNFYERYFDDSLPTPAYVYTVLA